MANTKISALTSATTPLAGTEVLPIVQSSATVKVATNDLTVRNVRANATTGILQVTGPTAATTRVMTVPDANFTAARTDAAQSFTGDQTLSTGNIIQGTAAKGFNFTANTNAAGMTSELLNWYEEGTFTPSFTGLTVVGAPTYTGKYTRVGRVVYFSVRIQSTTTTASTVGVSVMQAFPFVIATGENTVLSAINNGTLATIPNGVVSISGGSTTAYLPTWAATADVVVSGFYTV